MNGGGGWKVVHKKVAGKGGGKWDIFKSGNPVAGTSSTTFFFIDFEDFWCAKDFFLSSKR